MKLLNQKITIKHLFITLVIFSILYWLISNSFINRYAFTIPLFSSFFISKFFYEEFKIEGLNHEIKNLCMKYEKDNIRYSISVLLSISKEIKSKKHYLLIFDEKQRQLKPVGGVIKIKDELKKSFKNIKFEKEEGELRFLNSKNEHSEMKEWISYNITKNDNLLKENAKKEAVEEGLVLEKLKDLKNMNRFITLVDYSNFYGEVEYLKHHVLSANYYSDKIKVLNKESMALKNNQLVWCPEIWIHSDTRIDDSYMFSTTSKLILTK